MLLGRDRELEVALATCRTAAGGHGGVLVVSGEPGIGKTALLTEVANRVSGRTLVATGVELESAIPLSTTHQLLHPLRAEIAGLVAPHRKTLEATLALDPAASETRSTLSVAVALISLLSIVSTREPLTIVVDDAQWVDQSSQEVLSFVGHRVGGERIALLVGTRSEAPSVLAADPGWERLELGGLGDDAARELLRRSSPDPLAPAVETQLAVLCAGNPLGLRELPRLLEPEHRSGRRPLPSPVSVSETIKRAFGERARSLSVAARSSLLLLAGSGGANRATLARAGADLDALLAEGTGLVEADDGHVVFRHPLVAAAVYAGATHAECLAAHRALADATTGARRAWHLSRAVDAPDEEVASSLEEAATLARRLGDAAAAAEAYERAAALSLDRVDTLRRQSAAAAALRAAGRLQDASRLLETTLQLTTTAGERAEIQLARGELLLEEGLADDAFRLLTAAAAQARGEAAGGAATLLATATYAAQEGRFAPEAGEIAAEARALAGAADDRTELSVLNASLGLWLRSREAPRPEEGEAVVRAAELVRRLGLDSGQEPPWIGYCLALHERDADARELSDVHLRRARATADIVELCHALYARAALEVTLGATGSAEAYADEAVDLADAIAEPYWISEAESVLAEVHARQGRVRESRAALARARASWPDWPRWEFTERHLGGIALLGTGAFGEAATELAHAATLLDSGVSRAWHRHVPLDYAEALTLGGRRAQAIEQLRRAEGPIEASSLARPKLKLARVRVLVVADDTVDRELAAAQRLLDELDDPLESARLALCAGERLVRAGRSNEARTQLDQATIAFTGLRAFGWADRARAALSRAGSGTRRQEPLRTSVLTRQELRVARYAASGMRDREIAAALFLSPRTVESHLQRAFRKLGAANRTQLSGILAADGVRPLLATETTVPELQ
ncbi:MAG: LuxR family transcriptional regulator [Gaiellales bacterium]